MRPLEAGEPTVIGPYRLLGRLGSGGMGRVYLGRSAGGRTVAVKSVHPHFAFDDTFRKRFRREVEAARRVGGDWTAPVLDADPDAPVPWVATGYVAGPTLAAAVTPADGAPAPLPERTVRVLGASLAEALAHVHAQDLVHRDVKPSNVLLTMDGPRLIDFGIARATDGTASLTNTGASVGSPGYMAPEQILGRDVTGASDVFSLGAVLALAARGRPPFRGEASAVLLYKVVHEEAELDGIEGDLLDVVSRCLAKEPRKRPTPQEVARRLAPEGASGAVAAGWLPAPLVAELGRSAVRLLDLEAGAPAGPAPAGGAPAGFDATMGLGRAVGSARAGFGPAEPGANGHHHDPAAPLPGPSTGFGHPPPSRTPPPHFGPQHTPSQHTPPPGRTGALSFAVGGRPGGRRGPRVSCVVALAVTSAIAVVSVGTVVTVRGLLATEDEPSGADNGGATRAASPAPSAPGDVPPGYLGTWRLGTAAAGEPPEGRVEQVVVTGGRRNTRFATMTQQTRAGAVCEVPLTLKRVAGGEVDGAGRVVQGSPPGCPAGQVTVHLARDGNTLRVDSVPDPDVHVRIRSELTRVRPATSRGPTGP